MKKQWYQKRGVIIFLHTAIWVLLFSLPFLLRTSYENNKTSPGPHTPGISFYFFSCLIWISLFYLNAHLLIPKLIYKKKYAVYFFIQLLIIAIIFFLHFIFFRLILPPTMHFKARNFFLFNLFPYLFILACSTAYQMFRDKIKTDKLSAEKQTENLKTELAFLRSQVSPHFMFNVLNNMVSLARKQSELLEPSLIKLSSLMRYMLYETNEEKVPLEKEIEYLHSYIDLQQQRFSKKIKVNVSLQEDNVNYNIEPMLLIPFVENAFKHSNTVGDSVIDIELTVKNDLLHFFVRNKFIDSPEEIKDKTSGIGLNNVERRLNLLYSKNHNLLISKNDDWFTVSLQLNLY